MRHGLLIASSLLLLSPLACGPAQSPRHGPGGAGGAGGAGPGDGVQPSAERGHETAVGTADPGDIVIPRAGPSAPSLARGTTPAPASVSVSYSPVWKATTFKGLRKLEDRIVGYVNQLRKKKGLSILKIDERLRVAARQHTLEMVAKGYYKHASPVKAWATPALRACHAGFFDPYVSENIGKVAGFPDPAFAMFESWRTSPGHYANMVQPRVRYIGVGLTSVMLRRKTHFGTQLFATNVLDLRKLKISPQRRRVLRLTVDFATASKAEVKAWMGSRFVADVPSRPGGARFVIDLKLPRPKGLTLDFAVKVGAEVPTVCVHVSVDKSGAATVRRNTFDRRCRQVTRVRAGARTLTTRRSVLSGEARADTRTALKTRYYLNHQWGPSMKLRLGRWVGFSRALAGSRIRLSFVVGGIMKDYLWIDLGRKPVFRCP